MTIKEYQNVGKAKYVVSYSNGNKQYKDGSEFFDIAIFRSKKAKTDFITKLNLENLTN